MVAEKTDPTRAGVVVGAGGIGRADNARRSGKPPSLDLPRHPAVGGGAGGSGLPGQPPDGRVFAGRSGVQPPRQPKDQGRLRPSGPGRPVPVYPRAGRGFPAARATGRVRGHQEKNSSRISRTAGGNGVPRAIPSRCGFMTSWTRRWARPIPTAIRPGRQRGLGECRHRP